MGALHSVIMVLQSLLQQHELKVCTKTLEGFVKEVDRMVPWYICSGSLTLTSWDKLEGDLIRETQNGKLKPGTRPLWKLVRSFLQHEKCRLTVAAGQGVLEELQDSMSETERDKMLGAHKEKRKGMPKKKDPSKDTQSAEAKDKEKDALGEKRKEGEKAPEKKPLYPVKELEALELDSSESEELSPSEEEDLDEEAAGYEEERYHPDERLPLQNRKQKKTGDKNHTASQPVSTSRPIVPSTPLPYADKCCSDSFLSKGDKRKLLQAFPVFEAAEGGRIHAPIEYTPIKELTESVNRYGFDVNFTIMQLERLATMVMTPNDWQNTARANANLEGNQRQWTFELLTGQGQFVNNQTDYDWGAYGQISTAAIKAWKALSKKGEAGGHLMKILQGPQEPFSDFVARMTEAAGRIFGDPERVKPLIEQLVYKNASPECKAVITPRRSKGLTDRIKVCRGFGGPLTNAGLAAAILQSQNCPSPGSRKVCYNCGKPGHLK
uniref:igE-binding protein-like n=1 Tax=Arvicanthis niloticus TaxID=61156 RepID=UPI001486802E|nr:igE-binding protein-like [Arvicanthis niloticus]